MNPKIRNEVSADVHAIDAITTAAFLTARHTAHTEQFIVKALRKTGKLTISLVAELGADVVGHVAISPVTISDASLGWYGLGPISVEPITAASAFELSPVSSYWVFRQNISMPSLS